MPKARMMWTDVKGNTCEGWGNIQITEDSIQIIDSWGQNHQDYWIGPRLKPGTEDEVWILTLNNVHVGSAELRKFSDGAFCGWYHDKRYHIEGFWKITV